MFKNMVSFISKSQSNSLHLCPYSYLKNTRLCYCSRLIRKLRIGIMASCSTPHKQVLTDTCLPSPSIAPLLTRDSGACAGSHQPTLVPSNGDFFRL